MIFDLLLIFLPLILLIIGGYVCSTLFVISEDTLVRCVTDFFMPLLVFYSLLTSDINLTQTLKLGGAVTFIVFVQLVLAFVYCRRFQMDFKAFAPPIIFMNSGFLGIPLMQLWQGSEAMNIIVIFDQVQTFYIFTIGIVIVSGGFTFKGLVEMAKSPLLWSIILGFMFKYASVELPAAVLKAINYCGAGAPALAIFALGCSLSQRKFKADLHLVAGIILRIGCGFMAGLAAVHIFGISGVAATVVIVASSLPSAVFSVMLPLRYGVNAQFAGGMVIVSTVLGIITIPLVFYLCELLI